jgi:hypothetical protein
MLKAGPASADTAQSHPVQLITAANQTPSWRTLERAEVNTTMPEINKELTIIAV